MNTIKKIFIYQAVIVVLAFNSCGGDKLYEGEMYKHIFSLVSSDNFNVRALEHDLDITDNIAYISVSCGGTTPTDKDLIINLIEDTAPFITYNRTNFVSESMWVNLLPEKNYSFDNGYTIRLAAGEKLANLPFTLRPEGLSPDSIYFISLKVNNFSNYELNNDKSDVLYRPLIKNFWSTQATTINYQFRAVHNGNNAIGTKRIFPLTHNRIRTTIGHLTSFVADTARINNETIIIEIDKEQGHIPELGEVFEAKVLPFKDRITILPPETDDPDYPNIFFIEFDGFRTFKTFLLHYRYTLPGQSIVHEIKEELRLNFVYTEY